VKVLRGLIRGWVYMRMGRIGGFALMMRRMVLGLVVVGRIAPWWRMKL
jgi:hypothetical protein